MKRKIKSVIYILSVFLLCAFIPTETFAGVMPMPIYLGGGGHLSNNEAIGLLIALNIPMVIIYLIRSIIWIITRSNYCYSFFEYVIYSDELETPMITTLSFITINGIALIVWVAKIIGNAL